MSEPDNISGLDNKASKELQNKGWLIESCWKAEPKRVKAP